METEGLTHVKDQYAGYPEYYDAMYRIAGDPELRRKLHENPAGVLKEQGVDIPSVVDLRVIDAAPDVRYVVLPPDPNAALSEDNLEAVAGGSTAQSAQTYGVMSVSSGW